MSIRKLSLLVSLVAPLAVATVAAGCSGRSDAAAPEAAAPAVAIPLAVVSDAVVPDAVTVTGTIVADESSAVVAETPGKVIAVLVERGQRVAAGDPLVRLDTRNAALGAVEARARVDAAKSQKELADAECRRAEALVASGAITKSARDRELLACDQARSQLEVSEAHRRLASKTVSDGIVRAPFAGAVSATWVSPGEWAGGGAPLVTLIDDDPLIAELQVPESIAARVAAGQQVELGTITFADRTFPATVARIGVEVAPNSRSLLVEAAIDPGTALRPGMFVEAQIITGERTLPAVPEAALRKRGSSWRAFVVVDGVLEERVVQRGRAAADGRVTITRGLVAGDQVAAAITEAVSDGARVAP